ncbi:docking protein 2 isoform X2 [Struthio camelus]|uniref:docking protein 2 isoform X2 n=1 Tax=Struthio camelus TaxID=8801 RepID=UPI003603B8D0
MDEAAVKQGALYLQLQQTFGKKWKKFWGILYRESSCSTARLELFEGAAPPAADKPRRSESGRRIVKLSDCVHVAEAPGDAGGPKDTVAFLLETTDKCYLLAAEGAEAAGWIGRLCELAFPAAAGKDGQQAAPKSKDGEFSMEENSLYSSRGKVVLEKEFEVTVRATESSERCHLWGRFLLRAEEEALELRDFQTLEVLYSWPYKFLRRFGRDKVTFSFEAGRRCASGEGNFEFETRRGNEIFQVIESAIAVQRGRGAEEPRRGGPADDACRPPGHVKAPSWTLEHEERGSAEATKCPSLEPARDGKATKGKSPSGCPAAGEPKGAFLPAHGAECPYAEPCDSLRRANPPAGAKALEKGRKPEPPAKEAAESEYAVPFDTIAKSLAGGKFGGFLGGAQEPPAPLYDSVRAAGGRKGRQPPLPLAAKPEHIYDEPEGLSAHTVYDEPEEVKGEAWRLQAAPEDPSGHEYPYNPQRDDYSVPKRPVPVKQPFAVQGEEWLGDSEYDNVALKFVKKRNLQ